MKIMQSKGWRTQEPLDDELTTSEPSMIADAVDLLLDKGNMSVKELVGTFANDGLDIGSELLEECMDLAKGTLAIRNDCKVIELKFRESRT